MTRRTYLLTTWLDDGRPSGANRRLHALIEGLPDALDDDEDVVIVRGPRSPSFDHPRLRSIELPIPAIPARQRLPAERRHLPDLLDRLRPDVVDLQGLPPPDLGSIPTILTLHDLRGLGPFRRRPKWQTRRALKIADRRASRIVVPSRATAEEWSRHFSSTPTVVPNALPSQVLAPLSGLARDRIEPFVLHVGHLEARKNLEVVIDALRACPELQLRTAGDDHGHRAALEKYARARGVADRVHHEGVVGESRLLELYGTCLGVVVPSKLEGFGYAALESLAAGCPTLIASGSALGEVTADAATLLEPDQPSVWSRALQELVSDTTQNSEDRVAMRRSRARTFSSKRLAEELLTVWRAAADHS